MPITPSKSTGAKGSDSGARYLDTGNSRLTATLTAVTATHSVIVVTTAVKSGVTTGDLVSGVTVGGTSATVVGSRVQVNNSNARHELVHWIVPNVSSGDKAIVLTLGYTQTEVNWHADSWAIATSSAYDKQASNTLTTNNITSFPVPASGTTATLSQAVELVLATAMCKYNWQWNDTYGEPGPEPYGSGFTVLTGISIDTLNSVSLQTLYKETANTAGQSVTWTKTSDGDTTLGLLSTFKISTVQRRLKVLAGTGMNSKTGITLYAWIGGPDAAVAQKWTALTAQSSGGILYANNPPTSWTTGSIVNCIAYQPANEKEGTSFVQGIVEEF